MSDAAHVVGVESRDVNWHGLETRECHFWHCSCGGADLSPFGARTPVLARRAGDHHAANMAHLAAVTPTDSPAAPSAPTRRTAGAAEGQRIPHAPGHRDVTGREASAAAAPGHPDTPSQPSAGADRSGAGGAGRPTAHGPRVPDPGGSSPAGVGSRTDTGGAEVALLLPAALVVGMCVVDGLEQGALGASGVTAAAIAVAGVAWVVRRIAPPAGLDGGAYTPTPPSGLAQVAPDPIERARDPRPTYEPPENAEPEPPLSQPDIFRGAPPPNPMPDPLVPGWCSHEHVTVLPGVRRCEDCGLVATP